MAPLMSVQGLGVTYGSGPAAVRAIEELSFDVRSGEFLTVVGPSGCGKTTLLRCVAGLMSPTNGSVLFEGTAVAGPPAGLAMVFQDYSRSLMPWRTVHDNVTFPLSNAGTPKAERNRLAEESLRAVGVDHFADKHPWQLSGGMQQRVAIARALAYRPKLLLMDEPFAAVDAQTRADLEDLVLKVKSEFEVTIMFVTHDIDESVYLGDRVVVLSKPPTHVDRIVDVDLGEHRDQVTTKETPEFAHLRADVFRAIKELGATAAPALNGN
ncbi:ABC transporter ATP-binding protein [Saccharomonospora sp. NPDC006951]